MEARWYLKLVKAGSQKDGVLCGHDVEDAEITPVTFPSMNEAREFSKKFRE